MRAEFWRRLERRLDHRGLTRTTSRQKFTSKDSIPKKLEPQNCWKHSFFVEQMASQDKKVAHKAKPYATTFGERRSDPLQSARDNSSQEEGRVADFSEVVRDAMEARGDFWSMSGEFICRYHAIH